MSEGGEGGGVNPNWDIVPNFLVFFRDALYLLYLDGDRPRDSDRPNITQNVKCAQRMFPRQISR